MKRILAILCVIACLCGLCVPALAADTITVSVKAPDEWTEVFLYIWESEAYEGWPGTAMTKGADGCWTLEVPTGYTNVIANNGNEKPQTVDLKMDGTSDVSITVTTDSGDGKHFNADVAQNGNSTPNTPDTPSAGIDLSGLKSLALVGDGIPGVKSWAVDDAAGDMTGADGVYTKVIAVTAGTTMKFKIAGNDAWDDAYNFGGAEDGVVVAVGTKLDLTNGGGSKDLTLAADKDCNLKFTVDLTGNVATLLVEETDEAADPGTTDTPDTPDTPDSGEKITVYAKVPADWKTVLLWAWDDNDNNAVPGATWPGTLAMTKGDDGWYSVQIPVGFTNMLVTDGNGAQCADLKGLEGGKDIYIDALTSLSTPVAYYEKVDIKEPEPTEPTTRPTRPTVAPTEPVAGEEEKPSSNNTVLFSIIGSVVVIAIAAVVYIILSKKKQ